MYMYIKLKHNVCNYASDIICQNLAIYSHLIGIFGVDHYDVATV